MSVHAADAHGFFRRTERFRKVPRHYPPRRHAISSSGMAYVDTWMYGAWKHFRQAFIGAPHGWSRPLVCVSLSPLTARLRLQYGCCA